MLNSFLQLNKKRALFDSEDKLLLAISGGVDSMVLLHLVSALDVQYAVAHCNFQLRGSESDADESLVKKTASSLGAVFHLKKCDTDTYATINKVSTQMAARDLRYAWFDQLRESHGYTKIVLAHHANDDVETFLLNMVRGTSIKGQKGMNIIAGHLIRPLLDFSKEEILSYAEKVGIEWRDDSSNDQTYYKRNFVRKEVVPKLEELNPDLLQTMKRNMARNGEIFELSQKVISKLRNDIITVDDGKLTIKKTDLVKNDIGPYILSELLCDFGFNFSRCQDVLSAIENSGKIFKSLTHRLIIDRQQLIIQELSNTSDVQFLIALSDIEIDFPVRYKISYSEPGTFTMDRSSRNAVLDSDKLCYPLRIRKWSKGDRFKPFGMQGQKLISDLLIDLKLSVIDKESVYVLESKSDIVWVIGIRISEDFKVTENTKRLMHIEEVV